jgi:hypothetical protein
MLKKFESLSSLFINIDLAEADHAIEKQYIWPRSCCKRKQNMIYSHSDFLSVNWNSQIRFQLSIIDLIFKDNKLSLYSLPDKNIFKARLFDIEAHAHINHKLNTQQLFITPPIISFSLFFLL